MQRLDAIRASSAASSARTSSRAPSPPAPKRTPPPPPPKREFTPEQQKTARDILRCKDYYQLLGVAKDADDKALKTAYKKKCLRVHPDKNAAPEADEAFKKVNAAMACLSDPQKRRQYDQVGNAEAFQQRESQGGGRTQHFHRGNFAHFGEDDFVTPEDFFNYMFFGQAPRGRNVRPQQQRERRQQRRQGEGEEDLGVLFR